MRTALYRRLSSFACLLILALSLSGCGANQAPALDEKVKATWSEVLNQYQRRSDLVPNLVETVKGYATHEKETLVDVTEARAHASQIKLPDDVTQNPQAFAQFEQSQSQLSGALSRLMVVSEKYPDLKADKNFMELQSQLEGTENRIAVARRDYIDAVQQYNTLLETIPTSWIVHMLYPALKSRATFTISDEAQEAPKVKF